MGRPRPAAGFAVRQAGWEAPEFNASDLNYSGGLPSKDARRRQKPLHEDRRLIRNEFGLMSRIDPPPLPSSANAEKENWRALEPGADLSPC